MSDSNEPCGCDESKRLRLDLANTIVDRDRVVVQTKLIAKVLGGKALDMSEALNVSYDFGLEAQNLADALRKDHDELKAAVCDYFGRFAVIRESDLYRYYQTMDKTDHTGRVERVRDALLRVMPLECDGWSDDGLKAVARAILDAADGREVKP